MKVIDRPILEDLLKTLYQEQLKYLFDDEVRGPLMEEPFIGIASADDPFFERFKTLIGSFHWTPQELIERTHPGARAVSVVSWCLPTPLPVRQVNRRQPLYPSREWSYHRHFGEMINNGLRRRIVEVLAEGGIRAAVAHFDPENTTERREGAGWSSRWSERHTAYVCGLGTFGLSGGTISMRGIAHRLGSLVMDARLPPDTRPYGDDAFAWCLGVDGGSCRVCRSRCPVGSIGDSPAERNKDLCHQHDYGAISVNAGRTLWWTGEYGCGLCQTGVPCEFRNPRAGRK